MKDSITFFFLLCSFVLSGQSFQELISEGDIAYDLKQYSTSADAYEKAFKLHEATASQYYNAACSFALMGDKIKAIKYLDFAADKGWRNISHIKRDADLNSLHDLVEWTSILERITVNLEDYEKNLDKPLKEKLEKIYVQDQTLRQLYKEAEDKFGRDSEEMSYFWGLINAEDKKNEAEVCAIIDSVGWAGKTLVGGKANAALWLVIQHAPLETQEKYLPLLKESVLQGESRGSDLALLQDRIQMRNGLPQIYGSQIITDEETGEEKVYEIKDPEYVNQRRAEVGLGTIEEYVSIWGIEWNIEQKLKD
jgi:hypothetical protein